jgi:hypothetical protein
VRLLTAEAAADAALAQLEAEAKSKAELRRIIEELRRRIAELEAARDAARDAADDARGARLAAVQQVAGRGIRRMQQAAVASAFDRLAEHARFCRCIQSRGPSGAPYDCSWFDQPGSRTEARLAAGRTTHW